MFGNNIYNSEVAKYDHLTQTIHLTRVEQDNVIRFISALVGSNARADPETVSGARDILRPMVHEMRHWVDMNCSIRGLQTLQQIFKLMAEPEQGNPSIGKLKKDLSLFRFIEAHDPAKGDARYPWHYELTRSEPLRHEPLTHISACFYSNNDVRRERILFKTPIYLGSMLETCAYFQELRDAVPLLRGHASWEVQARRLQHEELEFLQDPTMPEYHAIGHAMAAGARQSDALEGFSIASAICTLLLHMPPQMLRDSRDRVIARLGNRVFGGTVHAGTQMAAIASVCLEAAIIHYVQGALSERSQGGPLSYSDDLIFDLLPFWRQRREEFFERSHRRFAETIKSIEGPDYFHDSTPALIENNRFILEQQTLTPSIIRLPKRPPLILGDGNVLNGASEFEKQVPYYEVTSTSEAANLLQITELSAEHLRGR